MLKKVLALFTTLAIVFSMGTVTAFADPITGAGETTWVDEEVDEITLPTEADGNWDFVLDPQGLIGAARAGLFVDNTTEVDKDALAPFAGKILAKDYAPIMFNQSSYDVLVGVEINIIGDDTGLVIVDDEADVEPIDNIDKNILLSTSLAKDYVATSGVTFATAGVTVAVPLDTEVQTLEFVLGAPEYVFTNPSGDKETFEYVLKTGETGYGTQLQLGGYINQNADWSEYIPSATNLTPKEIAVEAAFTVTKATADDIAKLTTIDGQPNPYDGYAYGYIGLKDTAPPATVITATAISGVTAPVAGEAPVLSVTAGTGYTGTVSWAPTVTGTFAENTDYTATITLSPTTGYTLTGVTANQFTVAGATATNAVNSGVITAVFPKTGTARSVSATVTGAGLVTTTVTATGFTFPNATPATYTMTADSGAGTVGMTPATSVMTGWSLTNNDTVLSFTLPAAWHSTTGANKNWTRLVINWAGGTVTLTKSTATDSVVTAVYSAT